MELILQTLVEVASTFCKIELISHAMFYVGFPKKSMWMVLPPDSNDNISL